jgi:hypothetical protein
VAKIRDGTKSKFVPKFFGPYQVALRIGEVAYKLQLPAKVHIHNVFHIAFLKQFVGTPPTAVLALPPIVRGRAVPQPEQVVHARPTKDPWEHLVKWQVRPVGEASWELIDRFKEDYPKFQLEDELFRHSGGNVVDSFFGKQYSHRKKGPING